MVDDDVQLCVLSVFIELVTRLVKALELLLILHAMHADDRAVSTRLGPMLLNCSQLPLMLLLLEQHEDGIAVGGVDFAPKRKYDDLRGAAAQAATTAAQQGSQHDAS